MTRVLRQTEAWLEARQKRFKTRQAENGHIGVATKPQKPRGGAKSDQSGVSEHEEQVALVQWWDLWGPSKGYDSRLLFAIPNGAFLAGREKARAFQMYRLKASGVRPAVPDLFLAVQEISGNMASSDYGQVISSGLFIEMKRVNGKARKDQQSYHELLRSQGYRVVTCQGCEQAQAAIMEYLK